ncbi:MAG TPA: hypothetical protein PLY16_00540 [Candidatus Saccharibacteria bacterium]|nr:hypothetical protein [Candidatus Saccharibacteria bacterium]
MDSSDSEDIIIGLELSLMTQEQVVSEFRELVSKDIGFAALKYGEFAQRLETASSHGSAQVRSLVGGPDSGARAELVDIMVGNYASASDDVKERVLELAVEPLLKDNSFYVQLAITQMNNPYVIADILRKYPIFNPGINVYEDDLLASGSLSSPGAIQKWLNKFGGGNFYAAMAVALQRSNPTDVEIIIAANEPLFQGAAHIVASHHDQSADRKIAKDPQYSKSYLLEKYRSSFVDTFAIRVAQEAVEANWLSPAP